MKLLHFILAACCSFLAMAMHAQEEELPYQSYYFEGDEVVFEFDLRYFENATHNNGKKTIDFDGMDIYEVAVAGDFNNWSRKKWIMKKVAPERYQLRKKITDFDDEFKWEYKFVINGKYWAEPGKDIDNKSRVTFHNKFWSDVYNLDLYTLKPTEDGNARFFLPGYEEAERVVLSGTFNDWDEEDFLMNRTESGWELRLPLPAGRYEYKFIVDGEWMEDPNNPNVRKNEHSTLNSILYLTKPITFHLSGFNEAGKVILAGSFNQWKEEDIRMHREGNYWVATIELPGGKHHYKFIVDGEWILDPDNPFKEHDGSGHINSVIMVQ